jgi:hypothetical protein
VAERAARAKAQLDGLGVFALRSEQHRAEQRAPERRGRDRRRPVAPRRLAHERAADERTHRDTAVLRERAKQLIRGERGHGRAE